MNTTTYIMNAILVLVLCGFLGICDAAQHANSGDQRSASSYRECNFDAFKPIRIWHFVGSATVKSVKALANLGGLVAGVILGGVLLWGSVRSAAWDARTTIALYLCWIGIFGWYWFNRFGVSEVHSFDPRHVEVERIRQLLLSGAFFLLWMILCSIGPAFSAARKLRH
jgi:hypothetical protein